MHDLQQCNDAHLPVQLTPRSMNVLNEGQKGKEYVTSKSVQRNFIKIGGVIFLLDQKVSHEIFSKEYILLVLE